MKKYRFAATVKGVDISKSGAILKLMPDADFSVVYHGRNTKGKSVEQKFAIFQPVGVSDGKVYAYGETIKFAVKNVGSVALPPGIHCELMMEDVKPKKYLAELEKVDGVDKGCSFYVTSVK